MCKGLLLVDKWEQNFVVPRDSALWTRKETLFWDIYALWGEMILCIIATCAQDDQQKSSYCHSCIPQFFNVRTGGGGAAKKKRI